MTDVSQYVVSTGADGHLTGSVDDVTSLVDRLRDQDRLVLHFHGGLISEDKGEKTAERLHPVYEAAGAYPVFFVWRSGLVEILRGNLDEIAQEALFRKLRDKLIKWTEAKRRHTGGAKAASDLPIPPRERDLQGELAKVEVDEEPYAGVEIPADLSDLTDDEADEVMKDLESDTELRELAAALADAAMAEEEVVEESAGVPVKVKKTDVSLVSSEVVDEVKLEAESGTDEKGVREVISIAKKAVTVLARVIRRLRINRDHGLYPTVVEEILREFYVANVGAAVWSAMKGETSDAFEAGATRGGTAFLAAFGAMMNETGRRPEVTLVGHSTGAVYINNLLAAVADARADATQPFPADFKFKNVVFLAPACTYDQMADVLSQYGELVERFRMFTMTDSAESSESLVPGVYTRSLLYFISGVLEREADGSVAFDEPLVGLERHFADRDAVYAGKSLEAVRGFLVGAPDQLVWAPTDGGAGLSSGANTHTGFDDEEKTLASIAAMMGD